MKNSNGKWCAKQPSPAENEVEQICIISYMLTVHVRASMAMYKSGSIAYLSHSYTDISLIFT